ncbi:MAG: DUF763 domain-containing protein [Thaumarchaeota archaeon]|nr:DUF763 domain-containing protein [Nitrososphaerota archaeon]
MRKTGYVVLPLHGGHAPAWLTKRMKLLADEMVRLIVLEHGPDRFLQRMADPYWFQALGCVLGFDWHSSGLTTVTMGIMKDIVTPERHGIVIVGGKGRASRSAPTDIEEQGSVMGLSSSTLEGLKYASRICAKVDSSAIQAGYPIYHHTLLFSERGRWAVIQQGMNSSDRSARRYHWLSEHVKDYVVEPHDAIVGDSVVETVLNMTAREAEENRKICVDLVKQNPANLVSSIKKIGSNSVPLDTWTDGGASRPDLLTSAYEMPADLNWDIFQQLYDTQPRGYEELLAFRGVGPATVRALALVAQLVYGAEVSWRDPVKFSFAHGGKDGVPFPVNRPAMDDTIKFLRELLEATEVERSHKKDAIQRLEQLSLRWSA